MGNEAGATLRDEVSMDAASRGVRLPGCQMNIVQDIIHPTH